MILGSGGGVGALGAIGAGTRAESVETGPVAVVESGRFAGFGNAPALVVGGGCGVACAKSTAVGMSACTAIVLPGTFRSSGPP